MLWLIVTLAAVLVSLLQFLYERITGDQAKLRDLQRRVKEAKRPEDVQEHLVTLNKIMIRRMVVFLILFLPLIYALNGLGTISTPFGSMAAIWWFIINSFVVGAVIGGVSLWIRKRGASRR